MGPVTCCIFSVVCCILVMMQGVQGKLLKPTLEIDSDDPTDIIMIGSTANFSCRNSKDAKQFYLRKGSEEIKNQTSPLFTITSLNKSHNGSYTCYYKTNSELSEPSDPEFLYVNDKFPPPTITAEPHSIVQPGQDVTIKCTSLYPDIVFTLFKGSAEIKESDNNPLIHVIHNMNKQHAGQYSCRYQKLQLQSHWSSPLMIDVKALPKPSIIWERYGEEELNIRCIAPDREKRMWFQLFNGSKDVIDEKITVQENQVNFIIPYPDQSFQRFYCIYRIRMERNFADSLISDAAVISEDYTMINIIRLLLSTPILILLTVIVMKHFKGPERHRSRPPELPAPRRILAVESEYTKMEVMKTEEATEHNTATLTAQTDNREESSDGKEAKQLEVMKTEEDTQKNTAACDETEAKQIMPVKNDDSVEKSVSLTSPTTVVYAVIENVTNKEEQQTYM